MNNTWGKLSYIAAAMLFAGLVGTVSFTGCLTPSQKIAAAKIKAANEKNKKMVDFYDDEIALVQQMLNEKKIDGEKFKTLVNALRAKQLPFKEAVAETAAAYKALGDAEAPWWLYVLGALGTVATVAGRVLSGRAAAIATATADVSNTALGTLSRGIDNFKANPEKFTSVTKAISEEATNDGTRTALAKIRVKAAAHEI